MTDAQMPPDQTPEEIQRRELLHPENWPAPQAGSEYQLVVIGGGTAGLVAAAGAAGLGTRVALIERNLLGGDCLNTGCVPSKALIRAARAVAANRLNSQFGIPTTEFTAPDFPTVMQRMRTLRAGIAPHDSAQRFRELGVDVFFGSAQFTGTSSITVDDCPLRFSRAMIATGSQPRLPPVPGLANCNFLTTENLFELESLPARLVVLSGGPIGVEMAQTFARLGSAVTLIETGPRILHRDDPDASELLQQQLLQHDGINLLTQTHVVEISEASGTISISVSHKHGESRQIQCDRLLVAVGREARVRNLQLNHAGVNLTADGLIQVNEFLQTSNPMVYAAGDVCTTARFTHAADRMSRIALRNALFAGRARFQPTQIPRCTYTSPEVAHVGIDSQLAKSSGVTIDTFTEYFSGNDRSILDGDTLGFVRIHVRRGSDRILGATIVGEHAGNLISEISVAMAGNVGLKKLADVVHPYPTHADAVRRIGDQYLRTRLTPFNARLLQRWLNWRFPLPMKK